MKQIGIMGGTFDPPHLGHLMIAEQMRETLNLDQVRFMPNGQIVYKETSRMATPKQRLEMVRLAIQGNPAFVVDTTEIDWVGTTYTYQTMEFLTQREPDAEFTFLMGADSLDYMERWKYPERIFSCCKIAAVLRPGFSLKHMQEKQRELESRFGARITLVESPQILLSSTELRQRLKDGKSVRYLIPEAVDAYIKKHGLYSG